MSNNATATNNTATNAGTTTPEDKKPRAERLNRKAAADFPIKDAKSAQAYVDGVLRLTATEKNQPMYNGHGFTTPAGLATQDVENLVRMSVSISAAIAQKISDPTQTEAATRGLAICGEYNSEARDLAQTAHDERVLAEAARIKARQQTAKKN